MQKRAEVALHGLRWPKSSPPTSHLLTLCRLVRLIKSVPPRGPFSLSSVAFLFLLDLNGHLQQRASLLSCGVLRVDRAATLSLWLYAWLVVLKGTGVSSCW